MNNFKMPQVKFEPLLDTSEESFLEVLYNHSAASGFLVYLRCKYLFETKWDYLIDYCCICNANDLLWFNDWYEGQEDVEYLGIAVIDYPLMED